MYLAGQDSQRGYAMAALLVSIAVMAVLMSAAMPVWRHAAQREKEAELVFRGEQYARAIGLYQRKLPGTFPPSTDVLVQQRFLRKKYKDPMTADGEFQIIPVGGMQQGAGPQPVGRSSGPQAGGRGAPGGRSVNPGGAAGGTQPGAPFGGSQFGTSAGIMGVVSKSKEASIRLYKGRGHYNEWQFLFSAISNQPGGGRGRGTPGGPDGQERPGIGVPGGPGGRGIGGPAGGRGPGRGSNPGGRGLTPGVGRGFPGGGPVGN